MPIQPRSRLRQLLFLTALPAILAWWAGPPAAAAQRYRLIAELTLGSPSHWNYIHYEPRARRVYVAHGTEITVVDARKDRVVGRIDGIADSHGIVAVPALGRGYADDGITGKVTVFQLSSLKPIGQIPADRGSDGEAYDTSRNLLVVVNGHARDASLIDAVTDELLTNVPLGGKPAGVITNDAGKAFVNISSSNQIVRIYLADKSVDARWPIPGCLSPHGLAIDSRTHRLFIACANARMVILNASSGRLIARLPISAGTDSTAFDPERELALSLNKDGTLSEIGEESSSRFLSLGDVSTVFDARTMAEDPKSGDIFLVTADMTGSRAADCGTNTRNAQLESGAAKLLVFAPVVDLSQAVLHQGGPSRSITW